MRYDVISAKTKTQVYYVKLKSRLNKLNLVSRQRSTIGSAGVNGSTKYATQTEQK